MSRASNSPPLAEHAVSANDAIRATMSIAHVMTPDDNDFDSVASTRSASAMELHSPPEDWTAVNRTEAGPSTPQKRFTQAINTPSPKYKAESTGSPSTFSSSPQITTPPNISPSDGREFECANDPQSRCQTGQYTLDLSRKVISDHFGRNKSCTRQIKRWPLFCRKHYQRATYTTKSWQTRKISLILDQFDEIEREIPGTKYHVMLKKSEDMRLLTYLGMKALERTDEEIDEEIKPSGNAKTFEAPIDILEMLAKAKHFGKNKTIHDVKDTVDELAQMLHDDAMSHVPAIEFLPQLHDGAPYTFGVDEPVKTATPRKAERVSDKGAIVKPSPSKSSPKSKASPAKARAVSRGKSAA